MKYKTNLKISGNIVWSYDTHVATITRKWLITEPWNVGGRTSSPTTTKHTNYVARYYGLEVITRSEYDLLPASKKW